MTTPTIARKLCLSICGLTAALSLTSTPALAQHARFYAGWHGGGWHGGYHGGWGWGWGWHGGWGPWGWGWGGLGLGLYFATLPYAYNTYYWGGVPYYYANYTYYRWDPNSGQYVTVAPPSGIANQAATRAPGSSSPAGLIVYPKNGQSDDQTNKDKFECHQWAVGQTGFDPTQPNGGSAPGAADKRSDYFRAQSACLEGRGYTVK